MKKRIIALLLSAVLAVSCCGCVTTEVPGSQESEPAGNGNGTTAGAPSTDAEGGKKVLGVAISSSIDSLSPFNSPSTGFNIVAPNIYMNLGDRNGVGGELVSGLMKSWKQVDPYTYEIELYDYIHDWEGNPVTASDVAFCIDKATEIGNIRMMKEVNSYEITGDYTLKLVLKSDVLGEFEDFCNALPIVSKVAYEASEDEMSTHPVGTTAYKVTEFTPGASLTVEKVDDFWQTDEAALPVLYSANSDVITYSVIKESSQRAIAIETGSVQIASDVSYTDVSRFDNNDAYVVDATLSNACYSIAFNCLEGAIFDNAALRQAVCYAIDSNSVLLGAIAGAGETVKTIGSDLFGDYLTKWDNESYFEQDLDKAKALLKEAGYSEGELNIRIMCESAEPFQSIAEIVLSSLSQIGINAEIKAYDSTLLQTYGDASQGMYDIVVATGRSDAYIVTVWTRAWDRNKNDGVHTQRGIADDKLQRMLETACSSTGHTEENIDALHQYVKEQAYQYGLFSPYTYTLTANSVSDLFYGPSGYVVPGACSFTG